MAITELTQALRERRDLASFWTLGAVAPELPPELRERLEAALEARYRTWWTTHVEPLLEAAQGGPAGSPCA
jgi:hypothetical protein